MKQPLAYVHPDAKIANNVVIEPFVTIDKNVIIGEGTQIGSNVTILEMMRMVYLKGSGIGDIVQQLCVLSCFATILYGWAIHSYRKQQ